LFNLLKNKRDLQIAISRWIWQNS